MVLGLTLYLILHIFCGYLGYGYTLAYFQKKWPRLNSRKKYAAILPLASAIALAGPIGLLVPFVMGGTVYGRVYSHIGKPEDLYFPEDF